MGSNRLEPHLSMGKTAERDTRFSNKMAKIPRLEATDALRQAKLLEQQLAQPTSSARISRCCRMVSLVFQSISQGRDPAKPSRHVNMCKNSCTG